MLETKRWDNDHFRELMWADTCKDSNTNETFISSMSCISMTFQEKRNKQECDWQKIIIFVDIWWYSAYLFLYCSIQICVLFYVSFIANHYRFYQMSDLYKIL